MDATPPSTRRPPLDVERAFADHHRDLCRVVHAWAGSRQVALDIVQDVFQFVLTKRHELYCVPAFRTWLIRAARHRWLKHRHASNRYAEIVDDYASIQRVPGGGEDVERRMKGLDFLRALGSLTLAYREVAVLSGVAGLRDVEIAEILEIPAKTVATRKHRAAVRLRTILEGQRPPPLPDADIHELWTQLVCMLAPEHLRLVGGEGVLQRGIVEASLDTKRLLKASAEARAPILLHLALGLDPDHVGEVLRWSPERVKEAIVSARDAMALEATS